MKSLTPDTIREAVKRGDHDAAMRMLGEPPGECQWVPKEPTEEMIRALVGNARPHPRRKDGWRSSYIKKWKLALAAAPSSGAAQILPYMPEVIEAAKAHVCERDAMDVCRHCETLDLVLTKYSAPGKEAT
jgi:hypothetical protein